MNTIRGTAIEFVLIGAFGVVVALLGNAVRARGSIDLGKNYFFVPPAPAAQSNPANPDDNRAVDHGAAGGAAKSVAADSDDATTTIPATPEHRAHSDHPYQEVGFDAVQAIVDDPDTASGLNVIVDARRDDDYEDGHIPGALQCYPYEIGLHIDAITDYVIGARKVVVYCGGGECADSIFMCRELAEMGVPMDAIYLFPGGWTEWIERGGEVETGRVEP
jgi:rhodanese-related sulfurtransferase